MGRFVGGFVGALLVLGAGAALVFSIGAYDVAASRPADVMDRLAVWVKVRSVSRHAKSVSWPAARDAADIEKGLQHYSQNCLPCHGAPGVEGMAFREGMFPAPPEIDEDQVQRWSDSELFWIVKNGIRMTGMPAFGENHADEEIAAIVAFVRHAPKLTEPERARLRRVLPSVHPD
jgi:mono/diheme cytochrome c family protein